MGKYDKKEVILAIQEPNLNPKTGNITCFNAFNVVSFGKEPRAAIIACNSSLIIPCNYLSDRDLAVAIWKHGKKEILVCSTYFDQTEDTSIMCDQLKNAIEYAQRGQMALIITGDFKSANMIWGSLNTSTRGSEIEK